MFTLLKKQVRLNFDQMSKESQLFYKAIDRDVIWERYLDGFTDPIAKQGHNCNCCKSFLRQYAGVVAIIDNEVVSIWDNIDIPSEFETSIASIQDYLKDLPITDVFFTDTTHCGTDRNITKESAEWEHFYFKAPQKFIKRGDIDATRGTLRTQKQTIKRALDELTIDSVDTVLELIAQNSLYRGSSSKEPLENFRKSLIDYNRLTEEQQEFYAWTECNNILMASIRNTSIGTLLVDISGEVDLEVAIKKYDDKVAPHNYKRPTALATPKMIQNAKDKLKERGLLGSLQRRFASPQDISLDDLLYIDKSSELMDEFAELTKEAKGKPVNKRTLSNIEEVTIEKFIADILPSVKSIELFLEKPHLSKMVSLITAEDESAPSLFKWDNLFSWSYTGGITDSIKERVKRAGGQVTGALRCSLSWFNYDDLDIHVHTPAGGHIYFSALKDRTTQGTLDVDMNVSRETREGVENIIFPKRELMMPGAYIIKVNNYSNREDIDQGYIVQVEFDGQIIDIPVDKSPRQRKTDTVAVVNYDLKKGFSMDKDYSSRVVSEKKWGVDSNTFVKVNQIMLSPNFWNGKKSGNKHFMFMLDQCNNDETAKPFFNEFLKSDFNEDRKTFEMLNSKFKVEPSQDQISGVGFSETIASEVILRVEGKFKRLIKIKF